MLKSCQLEHSQEVSFLRSLQILRGSFFSFFHSKRGSMFYADVTICKQLRYTSCGMGQEEEEEEEGEEGREGREQVGAKDSLSVASMELVLCCVSFCRFAIQLSGRYFYGF